MHIAEASHMNSSAASHGGVDDKNPQWQGTYYASSVWKGGIGALHALVALITIHHVSVDARLKCT
jgi:hypothetical protein